MNDLLPSTDNFFKYLLTIGLLLIIFTIMYPIQKQKEVDLEILNYRTQTEIANLETSKLARKVEYMDLVRKNLQTELDSLKQLKEKVSIDSAKYIEGVRIAKKALFDNYKESLLNTTDSLIVVKIKLKSDEMKIAKLDSYFSFFRVYKIAFLLIGIFLTLFGLRYWIAAVYADELKKGKEIGSGYRSSFVRHVDRCKRYINRVTISIVIILLITLIIIICSFN